ncbi:MAG TPA: radical SAM protein [Candidatus Omnitrophota bacterium]|nr:radical SAM protein [Candidatus Omnitrophota bacterium]HPT07444.1 radical SAM protein [Candidatus Omnitrophota bacterium]
MNIALICPSQEGIYGTFKAPAQMHMGIAYLAAVAKPAQVRIIDMHAEHLTKEQFAAIIHEGNFDIVGFSVVTPAVDSAFELASAVKKVSKDTLVVFGGVHPTILPQDVLTHNDVDVVVIGEGEVTFRELIQARQAGKDISDIPGLAFRKDGAVFFSPARPLIQDLDVIPFPARELFIHKEYTYPDSLYKASAPIITSRGCPGRCSFCASHKIFGRTFRMRSAAHVVDEIEDLVKRQGIREIHIWDDNFVTDRNRVFAIRDEVVRRKLQVKIAFPNGMRADFINAELLTALKQMGVYSIAIGVESGSQRILDTCHKGVRLARIEEAFTLMKKMGFETWAFFMFGLPGETEETIRETIAFALKLDPDIAKFHLLKPFPGNETYEYFSSKGFILTNDYRQYGFHTPPIHRLETLMPEDMVRWQKIAYRKFYFRPGKIIQQIFRMRSLNRCILNMRAALGIVRMIRLR